MPTHRSTQNTSVQRAKLALLLLLVIFVFGFALRLFRIDSAPSGAHVDEIHFGYIAYSLLQTGKDEHGVSWPLIFQGFGDQKLPGYGYALLPVVKTMGLSVTAIRIPSVFAGSALILLMYFFLLELTKSKKAGLLAALIVSTNPWPFFMSRFGFESNLALFFWVLGLNGLVRIRKHLGWGILAAIATALTWYCYIAYRPISILVLLSYSATLWFQHKDARKNIIRMLAVLALLIAPFFTHNLAGSNSARLKQVGIFSDVGITATINENRTFCSNTLPSAACSAIFNKPFAYGQTLANRFFGTYSPEYMATIGETDQTFLTLSGFGQFFSPLYPFFLWGLVLLAATTLFISRTDARALILAGLVFSPIPAILAGEPQKVRLTALLPFVIVVIVLGLLGASRFLYQTFQGKLRILAHLVLIGFAVIYLCVNALYFAQYFTVHVDKNGFVYQSYVRKVMPYLHEKLLEGYTIYIQPNFSDPAMYYAFYTQMDPSAYQKQAVLGELEASGFQHTVGLDRFVVTKLELQTVACEVIKTNTPAIYVSNVEYRQLKPIKVITSANGSLNYLFIYDAQTYAKLFPCN